jgi:hypothetical protein
MDMIHCTHHCRETNAAGSIGDPAWPHGANESGPGGFGDQGKGRDRERERGRREVRETRGKMTREIWVMIARIGRGTQVEVYRDQVESVGTVTPTRPAMDRDGQDRTA